MPAQRNRKLDVLALALLATGLFLLVSLATYNPADLSRERSGEHTSGYRGASTVSNTAATPAKLANACGRSGAYAAEALFGLFGWGAYFFVVSLLAFDGWLLARRPINDPVFRAIGWLVSLIGVATLLALLRPTISPGPIIGPGGYLGAAGRALLEIHFAQTGAYILTISLIVGGLLLSTDYWMFRLVGKSVTLPVRTGLTVAGRLSGRRGDAAGPETASDLSDGPAVRIRGKRKDEGKNSENQEEDSGDADVSSVPVKSKATKPAGASESASQENDDDESEESAAPATPPAATGKGLGSRLASALRIRNLGSDQAREEVLSQLDAASNANDDVFDYELPPIDLLLPGDSVHLEEHEKEVRQKAKMLEKTFADFGFTVKVVEIETGPVIAQYEVELEAGLRLSKITSLADDLAIALRVPSVRIVAPIPGKNTVGVEVPNNDRQLVRLREVIEETNGRAKKMRIPVFLGKDVAGNPMVVDLTSLPHLLIAGRTGTGKSVCLNSIIVSMLMTRSPNDVRMLMIDPKMVELSPYKKLPHLMHPVVTDMRKAEAILAWAVEKMEERYALLARAGVRHVSVYNQLGEEELMERLQPESEEERSAIPRHLPYIVIVADEMADLMMTAGKEVEQHIIRLAQKSRAVGIHLILATQKPTVDVITGLIKSNLPARIAFQVASRTDSRVVLDEMGADKLLGNGDMLFLQPGTSTILRGQGTYLSDDEINTVVDFVGTNEPQFVTELVQLRPASAGEGNADRFKNRDELYEQAIDVVIREGRGSVSLLQRALGIGYGRAARLVDFMAEDGFVGEYNGSQAREVLVTLEQWAAMSGQGDGESVPALSAAPPSKPKRNRILPEPDDEADDESFDEDEESDDDDASAELDADQSDEESEDAPWEDEADDAGAKRRMPRANSA